MEQTIPLKPIPLLRTEGVCFCSRLQVDAAWSPTNYASIGWILKKPDSNHIQEGSRTLYAQSPLYAEANAIKEAMEYAKRSKLLPGVIESDCQQVINQMRGRTKMDHSIKFIV